MIYLHILVYLCIYVRTVATYQSMIYISTYFADKKQYLSYPIIYYTRDPHIFYYVYSNVTDTIMGMCDQHLSTTEHREPDLHTKIAIQKYKSYNLEVLICSIGGTKMSLQGIWTPIEITIGKFSYREFLQGKMTSYKDVFCPTDIVYIARSVQ